MKLPVLAAEAHEPADLLASLEATSDPKALAGIVAALLRSGALETAESLAALTRVARDPSAARRAAALRALGLAPGADTARLDLLALAGRTDPEASVRSACAQALGSIATHDPPLAGAADARLADLATSDTDPRVRWEAAQAFRAERAAPAMLAAIAGLMRSDPDPAVRQAAIQTLGAPSPEAAPAIIAQLQDQLAQEQTPALRKSLLASIVRAGRVGAVPALEAIVTNAPDLAGDAEDYLAALGTGETDMDRIWAAKVRAEVARLGPTRSLH